MTPTSALAWHSLPLPRCPGQESGRPSPKAAVRGCSVGLPGATGSQRQGAGSKATRGHRSRHPDAAVCRAPGPVSQLCPCKGALDAGTIVTSGVRSELAEPGRGCPEIGLPHWYEDRACGSSTPHPKWTGSIWKSNKATPWLTGRRQPCPQALGQPVPGPGLGAWRHPMPPSHRCPGLSLFGEEPPGLS